MIFSKVLFLEIKIYVPVIDKICLIQKIGIRQEILNSIGLFMSAASFKYCIAYSYSDFSPYNYSLFAYDEKARLCSPLYDLPEENIIDNRSEQLYDLQFYKVTHCLPAEGFMYSFEEEVEENVNKINAVKLKATAEICIVERHPFNENFFLKRTGMLFLQSLELCLAHCRVVSGRSKCNAVLFSGEEKVCLLLRQNQPLQSRDVMRKSASQLFTLNYCYYNMTESSQRRDYNGRGNKINLRIGSMRVQCTVHEIPLLRKHMKQQCLLWKSKTLQHCIKFCARQYRANLCNAVYFEAEEKTCLHLLLNASQALHEYTESGKETIHFIEKCVEEQELDFFHYVAAENVHEQFAKLYEFFEICEVHLLNISTIRNAFAYQIPRKIYSLNRCLHICRRHTSCMAVLFSELHHQCKKIFKGRSGNSILVQDDEFVLALKECFKDRPDERKRNAEPLFYYFKETQEICAAEIYKEKNLTSWEVITINKDVSNFQMWCQICHRSEVSYSSEMKIYVPMIDKICLLQEIGIREEILNSMELFMSAASFKYCIAYSYSDFSRYNYCIFAYNEKTRSCSPLYDLPEENIIDNNSEQLYDLQFYKVSNCLPAEGFMYSFEEEVEQNVSKINAVKLKATAEICIVERHPFSENFLLKRTGMFFLESLELCLAQCRVLSVRGKCHAVLFSGEDGVCLLLRQNQPLQSRDVMRKSASQFFTMNYCYYNMTESSQRRDYNGRGKKINSRIGSMRDQCTVHEIPLLRKHMKQLCLLWKSKTLQHCIKFCARQYRANLCNAVYFEAEEKTCLHLLLNASQALHEYTKSKKETIHFIEKCVEVTERQEYQQESAINRIQSDVTSTSSPSRPRSSRTHNAREQQPDFFYYVASENVQERFAKLYEFFEICEVHLLNISIIRNAFAYRIPRKIYSMNRCLHICRRHTSCMAVLFSELHHQCKKIFKGRSGNLILVHTHELVFALKGCFKDRPDERKFNAGPLFYYFKETQEICAVEIYKQKNLTSWKVMTIKKDVGNFQVCLLKCIITNQCSAINYFLTKECYLIKPAKENFNFVVKDNSIFAEVLYCESGTLVDPNDKKISKNLLLIAFNQMKQAYILHRDKDAVEQIISVQELDFFHYVAAENVHEQFAKLYEFFEICEVHLLNISTVRNAFAYQIPRKIYSLNRCLHICRRHTSCMAVLFSQLHHQCKKVFKGRSSNSILVNAHEFVFALKGCFKDRPAERKRNADPLFYYFKETQEICAAEIYKQKNLTSWEVMTINKDVSNFQVCLLKCIQNHQCMAINYFLTKECYLIKPAKENFIFVVKDNSIFAEVLYCESGTLVDFPI
ncbi:hypothetical protein T01_811, partial [Trichinella spiralis]